MITKEQLKTGAFSLGLLIAFAGLMALEPRGNGSKTIDQAEFEKKFSFFYRQDPSYQNHLPVTLNTLTSLTSRRQNFNPDFNVIRVKELPGISFSTQDTQTQLAPGQSLTLNYVTLKGQTCVVSITSDLPPYKATIDHRFTDPLLISRKYPDCIPLPESLLPMVAK